MPLGWTTPVVCPSWSLSLAKPAGHTLSSINIFQTWPFYTESYQIFHCVWTKGCSSAVLLKSLNISDWFRPRYEPNVSVVEQQRDFLSRGDFFFFFWMAERTSATSDFFFRTLEKFGRTRALLLGFKWEIHFKMNAKSIADTWGELIQS